MLLDAVLGRFLDQSPMTVAVRSTLEYALDANALDALFDDVTGPRQDRQLLFSTCVDLMTTVVCRVKPSLHAAYQAADPIGVSVSAVYRRLARIRTNAGEQLVRHTATRLEPILRQKGWAQPDLLPGYRVKVLDGNHLAHTQRRIQPLRDVIAGPLPGHSLVVLDPALGLALEVVCCEDAHAQERTLLGPILDTVASRDVWVADRNFCTTGFLFGIAKRNGFFVIRRHAATLTWERESEWKPMGRTETGTLTEQTIWLQNPGGDGTELAVRRVRLTLDEPTDDGDLVIEIVTNLPAEVTAALVATVYRTRWTVETNQTDYPSSRRWGAAGWMGYHRRDGVARIGHVVPATPRGTHRRNRMSDITRRPVPPRAEPRPGHQPITRRRCGRTCQPTARNN